MAIFHTLIVLQVDVREKVEDLKVFYAGSIKAADTVHEDPEAGGVDILIWFL
jgi:hypothetical protein